MLKKISENFIASLMLFFILLLSCPPPDNPLIGPSSAVNNANQTQFGSLTINVSTIESKSFVPDIDMKPAIFEIAGNGPKNKKIEESSVSGMISVPELLAGDWTILVYAKNAEGILIGQGSVTVNILARRNVTASITINPIEGIGNFNLNVSWTSDEVAHPVIIPELYPCSGPVIKSEVQLSTEGDFTFAQVSYEDLANGYYTLRVKLYDGETLKIGAMEIVRIIADQVTSGSIVFENIAGKDGNIIMNMDIQLDDPIDIALSPESIKVTPGREFKLNSQLPSDMGNMLYTWYVNGEQINDADENSFVFKQNSVGLYRVDVSCFLADGSRAGSASSLITVAEALPSENNGWTFMIYMDGDNDLEHAVLQNLNFLESVDLSDENIDIIALVDRVEGYNSSNGDWTGTRLYKIDYDINNNDKLICSTQLSGMGLSVNSESELNMGSGSTLNRFVDFCQSEYPAPNYALIVFDHGSGWYSIPTASSSKETTSKAICTDITNGNDSLSLKEIKEALLDKDINVLAFEACLMAMVEVAYELQDCADIMIASEDVIPAPGFNYKELLEYFVNSEKTPEDLAEAIVNTFSNYHNHLSTTLSALRLNKMNNLVSAINLFADNLIHEDLSVVRAARASSQMYVEALSVDLYDFANHMPCTGSEQVKSALQNVVIANTSLINIGNGLCIYFPKITDFSYFYAYNANVISFVEDSTWDEFLKAFVDLPVDADSFESDNSVLEATGIKIGEEQEHNLHSSTDIDYYQFFAEAEHRYTIEVFCPADDIEKTITLFDQNGETVLLSDDNPNSPVSANKTLINPISDSLDNFVQTRFSWTCFTNGTYYFSIQGNHNAPNSGNSSKVGDYSLKLKDTTPGIADPIEWCGINWIPDTCGKWTIQNDELVMSGINMDILSYAETERNYNNFSIEVDVMRNSGSSFLGQGFVFRKNGNDFYVFYISGYNGGFRVLKYTAGKVTSTLIDSNNLTAIKPNLMAWNSIRMKASESTFQFYSNNILLATLEDSSYSEGTIGLFSYDNNNDISHFKDVILIEDLNEPTPTPPPNQVLADYGLEIVQTLLSTLSSPELPPGIISTSTEDIKSYEIENYNYLPGNTEAVIRKGALMFMSFFDTIVLSFDNDPQGINSIEMSTEISIKINGVSFPVEENVIVFP